MSRIQEFLKELCEISAPSGREQGVREYLINKIGNKADCTVDKLGNLIVRKKGKNQTNKTVMLDAHMDEVGIIATYITAGGFVKFGCVGGIDPSALFGKRVKFLNGIEGIIGCPPIHFSKGKEKEYPKTTEMYIDIGAFTREDAEKMVPLGESGTFVSDYVCFGNNRIKAKALDDRVGCAILLDMILDDLPYDITFTFTVGEETGLSGAKVATYKVRPDYAIVVESTTAADIADTPEDKQVCKLDNGPAVSFMDRHTVYNRELYNMSFDVAEKNNIKIQPKAAVAGGNNAGAVHSTADGCPTIAISVPCRYLHTGNCVISKDDLNETAKLVRAMAENIAKQ